MIITINWKQYLQILLQQKKKNKNTHKKMTDTRNIKSKLKLKKKQLWFKRIKTKNYH